MSLKDIEKLKEKVEKDVNSKLFVPLAEEYKKEGMLDDAINVLLNGLEKQPGYMSARVSLGKIYLEKGMLEEARAEFENVIKSIPDNLYAQKKLAELYRDSGEKDLAIKSFKAVLKLNPMDEDALSKLRDVEGREFAQQVPEKPSDAKLPLAEKVPTPKEGIKEMDFADKKEETAFPEEIKAEAVDNEELNAFKNSLTGNKEDVTEESHEEISVQEDEGVEIFNEHFKDDEEEISFGDIVESLKTEKSEIKDNSEEKLGLKDITDKDLTELLSKGGTLEDADKCISGGYYIGAMDIYKSIILKSPGDKRILQRIEDLKTLLKLTGKDNEILINKLNAFLEGINKRRDEFLGSS